MDEGIHSRSIYRDYRNKLQDVSFGRSRNSVSLTIEVFFVNIQIYNLSKERIIIVI